MIYPFNGPKNRLIFLCKFVFIAFVVRLTMFLWDSSICNVLSFSTVTFTMLKIYVRRSVWFSQYFMLSLSLSGHLVRCYGQSWTRYILPLQAETWLAAKIIIARSVLISLSLTPTHAIIHTYAVYTHLPCCKWSLLITPRSRALNNISSILVHIHSCPAI